LKPKKEHYQMSEEEKRLAEDVAATASTVSDWRAKIASLESQAAELSSIIAKSTAAREDRALASLLGNADAKAAISTARASQHLAEEELSDVNHYALPAARGALLAAEREEQAAHVALSHYKAGLAKRRRIGLSAKIDVALAALLPLIEEWDAVGLQIANEPGLYPRNAYGTGMGQLDEIVGNRRLRAALSKRFDSVFPNATFDERRKETLEASETRIWNLPPEQPEKKAA
jgi:hypothetical protein